MTRGQALRLTRKLYRELAVTGSNVKPDWTMKLINYCPLCQYVYELTDYYPGDIYTRHICAEFCPMVWPSNEKNWQVCHQDGGLWARWRKADPYLARIYAKRISELPRKRIKK